MDLRAEARFHHILMHMSAHGERTGADIITLDAATLFMTDTSYTFTAMFRDAEFEYRQVTAYFFRGLRQVQYIRGSEADLLDYCRTHKYDLPDPL